MDITPKTAAILALSQQNLKWETVLSELVDNSLDAGASRADIRLGPGKSVSIIDDGAGCKDIAAMLTIGDHRAHETTKLGRYGIGLKDAALFLKGTTEIDTTHKGKRSRVAIDWNSIRDEGGKWIAPDPVCEDSSGSSGTSITFTKFSKALPQVETQVEKLGFIFSPGILAGRQIRVISKGKPRPCVPYQLPELTDIVADTFSVEGRGVKLRAGIVKDGVKNKHAGFTRQHGHRTIDTTAMGAGHYSVSRIAGIVELDGSWALTKNKDDITELQDELAAEIYQRCHAILKKADLQSQQLESAALNTSVSELLSDAIRMVARKNREKRNQQPDEPQPGTVEPAESGKKRRRAAKVSDKDGPVERAAKSGLTLDWSDSLDEMIGTADLPAGRVVLNSELPILQALRRDNQSGALAMLAFGIFVHGVNQQDAYRHKYLPNMEPRDFMEVWSTVVARMPDVTPKAKRRAS